jgi:hypothetical protein
VNPSKLIAAAAVTVLLAGCAFQNKYEKDAEMVTRAVIANDLSPVKKDIAPGINITRVKVAEWSDELSQQGKLESLKETTENCPPATHCFNVKFEKGNYTELLRLDDNSKITYWWFHRVENGG